MHKPDRRTETGRDIARTPWRSRQLREQHGCLAGGGEADALARSVDFERFERAASANHYAGFGLGLWVVRELLIAMGGSVRVESEPQLGAKFSGELPRRA